MTHWRYIPLSFESEQEFARCRSAFLEKRQAIDPSRWLSAGVVTLGLGVALISGAGIASADESARGLSSSSAVDQTTAPSPGDRTLNADSDSDAVTTDDGPAETLPSDNTTAEPSPSTPSQDAEVSIPVVDEQMSAGESPSATATPTPTSPSQSAAEPPVLDADAPEPPIPSSATATPIGEAAEPARTTEAHNPDTRTASPTPAAGVSGALTSGQAPALAPHNPVSAASAVIGAAPYEVPTLSASPVAFSAGATLTSAPPRVPTNGFLTLLGLAPSNATNPDAPAASSPFFALAWGLVRRFQSTFFNQSPVVAPTGGSSPAEGVVTGSVGATDPDGDPLRYSVSSAPTRGTVVMNADGTYVYTATPDANSAGDVSDSFTVTVSEANAAQHFHGIGGLLNRFLYGISGGAVPLNDGSFVRAVIPVTVARAGDRPPVVASPNYSYTVDATTAVVYGEVHVSDPDGDPLQFEISRPVAVETGMVTVDRSTGTFVFVPTAKARHDSFVTTGARTAEFAVTVTNNRAFSTTISVTVDVAPKQPAVVADVQSDRLKQLVANGRIEVSENSDGTVRVIDGKFLDETVHDAADAASVVNRLAPLIGAPRGFADTAHVTQQTSRQQRLDGSLYDETYYYLSPTVDGIEVLGSQIVLVTDAGHSVTGFYSTYDNALASLDTTPDPTMDDSTDAVAVARAALAARLADTLVENASAPPVSYAAEKVIYPGQGGGVPSLAWRVTATDPAAASAYSSVTLYIGAAGANTGVVLDVDQGVAGARTATVPRTWGGTKFDLDMATDGTDYLYRTGDNSLGARIVTFLSRQLVAKNGKPIPYNPSEAGYSDVRSKLNKPFNDRALTALGNVQFVSAHYRNVLGFTPRDSKGWLIDYTTEVYVLPTLNITAAAGVDRANRSIALVFGDESESARDIVAHEYTHTVIDRVVGRGTGFLGNHEALSLEESYGDIMGNLIENKAMTDPGRYQFGEDAGTCSQITLQQQAKSACALRDSKDPNSVVNDGHRFHDHYSQFDGSVSDMDKYRHSKQIYDNSTIFSHAVASAMTHPQASGITTEQWERVMYGSLYKLSATSGFTDARSAIIGTAKSQGFTTQQIEALQKGFDEAGIRAVNYRIGASVQAPLYSGSPIDVVTAADGSRSFVLDGSERLYIVDTKGATIPVVTALDLGSRATDVAVRSDGRRAFVVHQDSGTLTVVDIVSGNPLVDLPIGIGGSPSRIAVSDDGRRAFVMDAAAGTVTVVDFSGVSPTVGAPVTVGAGLVSIAVSANGDKAVVASNGDSCIYVIDAGGAKATQSISVDGTPRSSVISADGSRAMVYIAGGGVKVIDLTSQVPTAVSVDGYFDSYNDVGFMAISADGKRGWVTNHTEYNTVALIDLTTGVVAGAWDLGDLAHSVATTADGKRAFVVTHGRLNVIDVSNKRDLATVKPYVSNIDINNNGSDYQQVTVSKNGEIVVATDISGTVSVLYGTAF